MPPIIPAIIFSSNIIFLETFMDLTVYCNSLVSLSNSNLHFASSPPPKITASLSLFFSDQNVHSMDNNKASEEGLRFMLLGLQVSSR